MIYIIFTKKESNQEYLVVILMLSFKNYIKCKWINITSYKRCNKYQLPENKKSSL